MDVTNKLQEVRIFFANNGFIAVLEEVTVSFVAFVEGDRVAGHKAAHDLAEWRKTSAEQEVKMVWNERPGVALSLSFIEDQSKTLQEGLAVLVVPKDFSAFDPPGHYMLQETGHIKSSLAGHVYLFSKKSSNANTSISVTFFKAESLVKNLSAPYRTPTAICIASGVLIEYSALILEDSSETS